MVLILKKRMDEIKRLLSLWKQRQLTLLGKIAVLKTLVISKLNHLFSALPTPNNKFLKELERLFYKFIWNKSNDKVKRSVLEKCYEQGGLQMINIKAFIKSLKVVWIRRVLTTRSSWKIFITKNLEKNNFNVFSVGPKSLEIVKAVCNPFWKDVFESWSEYVRNSLDSLEENYVCHQPIWYNHKIHFRFIRNWYKQGILNVNDLYDAEGRLYTLEELKQIFNISGTFIEYNALIKAIPKRWKEIIHQKLCEKLIYPSQPKWIAKLLECKKGCRSVYNVLQNNDISSSHIKCIEKWSQELNVNLTRNTWQNIFLIPFKATTETKLREFQFKILHRIVATKKYLFRIKVIDSNTCTFCGNNVEDLLHLFFECRKVKDIWDKLQHWLQSLNMPVFNWSAKEILLGMSGGPVVINHLIIITKYYVYRSSISKNQLSIKSLKEIIKLYYKVEKEICLSRQVMDKFYGKWSSFVNTFESPR